MVEAFPLLVTPVPGVVQSTTTSLVLRDRQRHLTGQDGEKTSQPQTVSPSLAEFSIPTPMIANSKKDLERSLNGSLGRIFFQGRIHIQ